MPESEEVVRRFEDAVTRLSNEMAELSRQLREDRDKAANTFVRKDVYQAQTEGTSRRVDDLERGEESREREARDFRRQLILVVLAFSIPAIAGLLLSINTYLSGGR